MMAQPSSDDTSYFQEASLDTHRARERPHGDPVSPPTATSDSMTQEHQRQHDQEPCPRQERSLTRAEDASPAATGRPLEGTHSHKRQQSPRATQTHGDRP